MMRRLAVTGIALGATLALVHAAASVTFILTNGTRVTGDDASTSDASPAMPYGEMNLMSKGDERSFGQELVAVIDYDGGRPDQAELAAVPNRGHLLVLKDGSRHLGRMASLRNERLRWSGTSGRIEEYGVEQIRRIYLDGEAAKNVFGPAPPPEGALPGTPRAGRQPDGSIAVVARQGWVDTGLTLQRGESVRFEVSGEIQYGRNENQRASAAGNEEQRNRRFPVSTLPIGALIGRIDNGSPFPIGASARPISMPSSGRLMLGINDLDLADNAGYFRVVVVRER